MEDVLVLDPACFIWDKKDFETNKSIYYELLDKIVETIGLLEKNDIKFFLNYETIDEMINGFPVSLVDQEIRKNNLSETISLIYTFFSKVPNNIIDYSHNEPDIYSLPNICRPYYSSILVEEMKFLLKEISTTNEQVAYLTIDEIWNENNNINLYNSLNNLIRTIDVLSNPLILEKYLNRNKKVFEPSPKHESTGWGTILPEHLENLCHTLIDTAVKDTESNSTALYEYSTEFNQFIIFRITHSNTYHAYPISEEDVPKNVKLLLQNK